MRADHLYAFKRDLVVDDAREIHLRQRGNILGPEFLGEDRSARPSPHVFVLDDGHDEHVALVLRQIQVPDDAGVDQVEHAVALNDGLS
jgi:hypothetical protein